MNKLMTLIKINLKVSLGLSAIRYNLRHDKKKFFLGIFITAAVLVGLGPLLAMYVLFLNEVMKAGLMFNQPQIILTMALLAGMTMVFFFGIFYIMSVFYFSEDFNLLVPLPLKPYQVLGGKLAVVVLYEYLTTFPILLPPLVIYALNMGPGIGYWLRGFIVLLISPVLPLTAATLLVVLLMRVVNLRKRKDLFAMVGGLLILAASFGFNFLINSKMQNMGPEQLLELLNSNMGLVEMIGRRLPPSIWATLGISEAGITGLYNLFLYVGISLLMLVLLLWIGNRFFYQGLLSGQESERKRQVLTGEKRDQLYGLTRNPVIAIYLREWRLLLRTPVYVLNGLGGALIGPMSLLLIYFTAGDAGVTQMKAILESPGSSTILVLIGAAAVMTMGGLNMVASTAVSREGSDFWISKLIPVTPADQMKAKLLHGGAVSLLTVATNLIVLVILFNIRPYQIFFILVLGMAGNLLLVVQGLITDVFRPKLEWSSPQEAVKQNLNGVIAMLFALVSVGLLFLIVRFLLGLDLPEIALYGVLILLVSVLTWLTALWLFKIAERKYRKLEV